MKATFTTLLGLGLLLSACGSEPDEQAEAGIQTALATERTFELDAAKSSLYFTVDGPWLDHELDLKMTVTGGSLTLQSDGELLLSSVEVQLADKEVGGGSLPPNGAQLSKVGISLAKSVQAKTDWLDDYAHGDGVLDLTFSWSVQTDKLVELSDQSIPKVPFDIAVSGDKELRVTLHAVAQGDLWKLENAFGITAIDLRLEGTAE